MKRDVGFPIICPGEYKCISFGLFSWTLGLHLETFFKCGHWKVTHQKRHQKKNTNPNYKYWSLFSYSFKNILPHFKPFLKVGFKMTYMVTLWIMFPLLPYKLCNLFLSSFAISDLKNRLIK